MKATLRIATKDAYCYIEGTAEGTPDEIVDQYGELYLAYHGRYKTGSGLTEKEMNDFADKMLSGEGNHVEQYEKANEQQQYAIQWLKRAVKRANYKFNKSKE